MNPILIYSLSHPINGEIRYIGQTSKPIAHRMSNHLYDVKAGKIRNHRTNWIKSLLDIGLKPVVTLIDTCTNQDYVQREQYWIAYYKAIGANLVNQTIGGEGMPGYKKDQVTVNKLKASLRALGRPVYQFDLQGTLIKKHPTLVESSENTGLEISKICGCCNGRRNSHGGFQWKYTEECKEYVPQARRTRCSENNSFVKKRRSIRVTEEGKDSIVYPSMRDAANATGIDSPNIINRIKGRYLSTIIKFEYVDTEERTSSIA